MLVTPCASPIFVIIEPGLQTRRRPLTARSHSRVPPDRVDANAERRVLERRVARKNLQHASRLRVFFLRHSAGFCPRKVHKPPARTSRAALLTLKATADDKPMVAPIELTLTIEPCVALRCGAASAVSVYALQRSLCSHRAAARGASPAKICRPEIIEKLDVVRLEARFCCDARVVDLKAAVGAAQRQTDRRPTRKSRRPNFSIVSLTSAF